MQQYPVVQGEQAVMNAAVLERGKLATAHFVGHCLFALCEMEGREVDLCEGVG